MVVNQMKLKLFTNAGFLFLLLSSSSIYSASLDINLRDEAIRLALTGNVDQSGLNFLISGLHHEDDRDLLTGGFAVTETFSHQSYAGLGGHLYAFDAKQLDGMGIALGGFFRQALPAFPGLGVGGQAYYGPDVISFDDVKQYIEYALRLEYHVLSNANVYAGYRYIRIKMDNDRSGRIDDGMHVGLRLLY